VLITADRHAVLTGPRALEVRSAPAPAPGPHDLVIRPDAVGICGTDLELLAGSMTYLASGLARYPIVPGHEWTGLVAATGAEVTGFAVGDRVVGEVPIGCGSCSQCTSGRYHVCPNRTETGIAGRAGAMASALVFPAAAAHLLPDHIDAADAALVEPLSVAYRGVSRAGVQPGEPLAVVGAGTIGMLAALTARALGIADVRLVEVDPDRRRFAAELGLHVSPALDERVPRVVEASGTAGGIAAALETCLDAGSVVLMGLTGAPATPVDLDRVVVRDLTIQGSLGSPGVWPEVVALVAGGQVRPSVLVSHRFGLADAPAAYALAASREPGVRKVLVLPNQPGDT
jgi:2-desacetyl-2-hydroxyethyl bacteriochlorophyllide A dehydrogenase